VNFLLTNPAEQSYFCFRQNRIFQLHTLYIISLQQYLFRYITGNYVLFTWLN